MQSVVSNVNASFFVKPRDLTCILLTERKKIGWNGIWNRNEESERV